MKILRSCTHHWLSEIRWTKGSKYSFDMAQFTNSINAMLIKSDDQRLLLCLRIRMISGRHWNQKGLTDMTRRVFERDRLDGPFHRRSWDLQARKKAERNPQLTWLMLSHLAYLPKIAIENMQRRLVNCDIPTYLTAVMLRKSPDTAAEGEGCAAGIRATYIGETVRTGGAVDDVLDVGGFGR